jgi:hypothetical protein
VPSTQDLKLRPEEGAMVLNDTAGMGSGLKSHHFHKVFHNDEVQEARNEIGAMVYRALRV